MIAYFDASSIVPLVIEEPGTAAASTVWDSADRIVSVRLTRVEAHAALAEAHRMGRLTARQLDRAKRNLGDLLNQLDLVEVDDELTRQAADLAETHALRAYDGVHLAAAERLGVGEVIVVAGDRALLDAATACQLAVASIG